MKRTIKVVYARCLYRYAVWVEYARPDFLFWQLGLMVKIAQFRNWIMGVTPTGNRDGEVDNVYESRFANWNKFVFIEKPESDWFANWSKFLGMVL